MSEPIRVRTLQKTEKDELLGQFLDESHYTELIDYDCDVYRKLTPLEEAEGILNGEHNIILKFRKNYFTKQQQEGAYNGLKDAAQKSRNRGLAAGPKGDPVPYLVWVTVDQWAVLKTLMEISENSQESLVDTIKTAIDMVSDKTSVDGMVWLPTEIKNDNFCWDEFLHYVRSSTDIVSVKNYANQVFKKYISDTRYANPVDSGIAGWFGRYPRIPYGRATSYTEHNEDKFKLAFPFLEALTAGFHHNLPKRYKKQLAEINRIDEGFYVPNTVFTTITVNKNFRTAAHRDAGDLVEGFSNLTVVAKDNDYEGGYLVLPEISAAVNIRPGDLLLVANHDYIHGNTPIVAKAGVDLERISLVCYFREDMLELGKKVYEDCRRDFVASRRGKASYNGVTPGMFESKEWLEYLYKSHPEFAKYQTNEISSSAGSSLDALWT